MLAVDVDCAVGDIQDCCDGLGGLAQFDHGCNLGFDRRELIVSGINMVGAAICRHQVFKVILNNADYAE